MDLVRSLGMVARPLRARGRGAWFVALACTGSVALACIGSALLCVPAASAAALGPGDLVAADSMAFGGPCLQGCGGLIVVDPSTGAETALSSNSMPVNADSQYYTGLGGLVVDSAGDILAADWGGGCKTCVGKIIEVDPSTGKESIFSSNSMPVNALTQYFNQPVGVAIDQSGNIFVADEGAFGPCSPGPGSGCRRHRGQPRKRR